MAAKLESSIEAELLQRLKQGMYGDIYNIHQKVYEKVGQQGVVVMCRLRASCGLGRLPRDAHFKRPGSLDEACM